ncbi:MAG: DUF971 domain-containing protein [Alphaproteobacteria bacterium]|nr:DUF971 domain-containing protein [Alphaproteobacteria bacterium]MBO6626992.1 DUF971 domain-containing protein [Alphaproteobacteria bacterium]MDF1627938.1 DUF971 domain-containing protein [Parvibaculaceae bacterium]|tara:strand:+ start:181 stop:540 length:360 start_codon:yes stop_codon:yes gene_type:complete
MPPQIWPTELRLTADKKALHIRFDDGTSTTLRAEYLRVESPSAEVQGHGAGQKKHVTGKAGISIQNLEPVGNYAVRIIFDDGHDSGLYTWEYLHQLGREEAERWADYQARETEITMKNK